MSMILRGRRIKVAKVNWVPASVILPSVSSTVKVWTEGGVTLAYWDGAVWRSHCTGAQLIERVKRWYWL